MLFIQNILLVQQTGKLIWMVVDNLQLFPNPANIKNQCSGPSPPCFKHWSNQYWAVKCNKHVNLSSDQCFFYLQRHICTCTTICTQELHKWEGLKKERIKWRTNNKKGNYKMVIRVAQYRMIYRRHTGHSTAKSFFSFTWTDQLVQYI